MKQKKINGTFNATIKKLKESSSIRMKQWHRDMKQKSPREYHIWQYERFKMIGGGYKCKLLNGIPVRNKLEREVGDFLLSQKIRFDYEPYININGKAYFPDFKINNIIIEVTEWKHPSSDKIINLQMKVKNYDDSGFETIVFIPPNLRKFYKPVNCTIVSSLTDLRNILPP